MSSGSEYPPLIVCDGPAFKDELKWITGEFRDQHGIQTLRLIPAKSAGSGVHSIYFLPEHRTWALVRLAQRYRWALEIQLNRGLAAEEQMIQRGFTYEDLEFLRDIIPSPQKSYNPVVYQMLWLVAVYDEYLSLAKAMVEQPSFTPRTLIASIPVMDNSQRGFLIRFLRSHLIRPVETYQQTTRSNSTSPRTDLRIELDTTYEVTPEGEAALQGIISEYQRIFEQAEFEPLLINQELDPVSHFREFNQRQDTPTPSVSVESYADEEGIIGDIARSFSSIVSDEEQATDTPTEGTQDSSELPTTESPPTERIAAESEQVEETQAQATETLSTEDSPTGQESTTSEIDHVSETLVSESERQEFGDFTRAEVLDATVAAAKLIIDNQLVRTHAVKQAANEAVDFQDRGPGELWNFVCEALISMDRIQGRRNGRMWAAVDSQDED